MPIPNLENRGAEKNIASKFGIWHANKILGCESEVLDRWNSKLDRFIFRLFLYFKNIFLFFIYFELILF
jgi:hypothetical protein